jgi:AraC-like DNA-binding protein
VVWIDGKLRIEGPDRVAAVEHFAPGGSVVGVRSRPAAARAWLGVSLSEIEGKRVPFDQFRGRDARRISDLVGEARDPLHAAQRLEYGLALAGPLEQLDEKDVRIFEIVRARRSTETGVLDELEQRLGLSERTLRRRCTEAYGYGPKTLDRILRLQRFLALACEARRLPLAVLAATVSYADQAHLTRETRALTGLTPTAIVGQLRRGSADSFKT